jgi:membrane protease YdiL (CAAX protease family)
MSDVDSSEQPSIPPVPPPAPKPSLAGRLLSIFWNRKERRVRALWRVTALVALMVASGVAIRAIGFLPERGTRAFYVVSRVVRLIVAVAAVWLIGRLLDRRRLRDFGLSLGRQWWTDLAFGLALGLGLMGAIFLVEWGLGWVHVTGTLRTAVPGEPFGLAILAPAVIFLCVGILEELLARGYLLRNLAEGLAFPWMGGARGGLVLACLVSSALFAYGHADNPNATWVSTVNIGIAGVFLALGYMLTGQLAIPIGMHITWNFFQATVFGFPVSGVSRLRTSVIATDQLGPELWTGGPFGPEAGLVGLAAMLLGIALTLLWVRGRRGDVRLATSLAAPPRRRMPHTQVAAVGGRDPAVGIEA